MVDQLTPIAIEKYLKGISFPASKNDLIRQAEDNQAPDAVINVLEEFSDKEYNSVTDVAQEAKKSE
ncbi:DUF2795 domain-containing protein [Candidatus Odyssella acanthamoebae]|nr:DUF2795 domain-containing protein [Candidatus Paracaedibacter acanthamoebae]